MWNDGRLNLTTRKFNNATSNSIKKALSAYTLCRYLISFVAISLAAKHAFITKSKMFCIIVNIFWWESKLLTNKCRVDVLKNFFCRLYYYYIGSIISLWGFESNNNMIVAHKANRWTTNTVKSMNISNIFGVYHPETGRRILLPS